MSNLTPVIWKSHALHRVVNSISPDLAARWSEYIPGREAPNPKRPSTYIAPVQLQRIRQDINTWRAGITEAENAWYPQRVRMQQMYLDTVLNGHVKACLKKRRDLSMLREFRFVTKTGEVDEATTTLFKKKWFFDFIMHTLNARFFGYSLIQIGDFGTDGVPMSVDVIKRHNVSPDRRNITQYTYSISGIPFNDPSFTIDGGNPYDWTVWVPTVSESGISSCGYGELYEVGIYEIMLRNLLGFNGDYVEVFGQPLRHAKTNKTQEDPERIMLELALEAMGSRAWLVTDPTDEIEFIQATTANTKNNPYENLEIRMEKKISKILLGHADAIDSIPGKLGNSDEASPAEIALNDVQVNDGRFIEDIVTNVLIPKLKKLGARIPETSRFEYSNDNELVEARKKEDANNKVTAEIFQSIKNAGGEPDWKYFTERTGIPVEKAEEPKPEDLGGFTKGIRNKLEEIYDHGH